MINLKADGGRHLLFFKVETIEDGFLYVSHTV